MINPSELAQFDLRAARHLQAGALESARRTFEEAFRKAKSHPPYAVQAAYSLAVFHWGEYGDGVEAKSSFEQVIALGEPIPRGTDPAYLQMVKTPMAYAAENLMLLSTSFDEFEKWTRRLRELAPHEPILTELVPVIQANHQSGKPWAEEMMMRGMVYINVGHFGTAVHPASGACVFHLMILNRKTLRMKSDVWQQAVLGYVATITEVGFKAEKKIRALRGDPNELKGLTKSLVDFTKEYCDQHPSDDKVRKSYLNAQKIQQQYGPSQAPSPKEVPAEAGGGAKLIMVTIIVAMIAGLLGALTKWLFEHGYLAN